MDVVLAFSQQMDFITVLAMCLPLMAVSICGLLLRNEQKYFTIQPNMSRMYNTNKAQHNYHQHNNYQQQLQHNIKQEASDSGISTSSSQESHNGGNNQITKSHVSGYECRLTSNNKKDLVSSSSNEDLLTVTLHNNNKKSNKNNYKYKKQQRTTSKISNINQCDVSKTTCRSVSNKGYKDKPNSIASRNCCVKSNSSRLAPNTDVSSNTCTSASDSSSSDSPVSSISRSPSSSANSSPSGSPIVSKRNSKALKDFTNPIYMRYSISEQQLSGVLEDYVVASNDLHFYGFPVESQQDKDCVAIYRLMPKHMARECVTKGARVEPPYYRHYYGSGIEKAPREQPPKVAFRTPDRVEHFFSEYAKSKKKQCIRCQKTFCVSAEGEYLSTEHCIYHHGKVNAYYDGKNYKKIYSCCQGEDGSQGCSQHDHHIWSGLLMGMNGPYKNFVHTRKKDRPPKVYALDCEMCYTGLGTELTKITVIGYDGKIVYHHYVLPQGKIIDYCTRYSGVSEYDLSPQSGNELKTFDQVRRDILELFDADTILIGHALENDLRALRLVHKKIVDTSIIFSHSRGYPYRQSLKNLTKSFLKRDIQGSEDGHCSHEDALATLNLMLWRVHQKLSQKETKIRYSVS